MITWNPLTGLPERSGSSSSSIKEECAPSANVLPWDAVSLSLTMSTTEAHLVGCVDCYALYRAILAQLDAISRVWSCEQPPITWTLHRR